MNHLLFRRAPASLGNQVVGASPASYTNSSASAQIATVSGGVVTSIEMNQGSGFNLQVGIAGVFLMFPSWVLRITYVVTPPTLSVVQL